MLLLAAFSCLFVCLLFSDRKVSFFKSENFGTSLPGSLYRTCVGVGVGGAACSDPPSLHPPSPVAALVVLCVESSHVEQIVFVSPKLLQLSPGCD